MRFLTRPTPTRAVVAVAMAFAAVMPLAAMADTPVIHWQACPASSEAGTWPALGDRLQCADIDMPLDHRRPNGATLPVEVVRVTAMDPAQREGSIFFNIGGPGGHPGSVVPKLAQLWSMADPNDSLQADKASLARRYDIVAVIPRGLAARARLECLATRRHTAAFLPTNRDDANWQRFVDDAWGDAKACRGAPGARYINTEQHVHDMDYVRRAIGDERIHFYGVSYGGLVGAWYAGTYPAHMGRMLLDSPVYFPGSFQTAIRLTLDAEKRIFERDVLEPVVAAPRNYGLSMDSKAIEPSLWAMPGFLRQVWRRQLATPFHLAAALHMNAWVREAGWHGWDWMERSVLRRTFSNDPDTDAGLFAAALELAGANAAAYSPAMRGAPVGNALLHGVMLGPASDSVWLATLCNDDAWWGSVPAIRARADQYAVTYWGDNGMIIKPYLTCTRWGGSTADKPDMDIVKLAAPFLMLQADDDTRTPVEGSEAILARFPNAHLIVAKHSDFHGLYNGSYTPCIEGAASHFLLTGEVPAAPTRRTACDFVPAR
ncbi:alpha/beta fold hydrolase [Luteibacter aegosomatissinici]|uniref:alpha/beta fold hydrolase n=1 Tax=Luteibacter aegosomatissinici TaxID=2911539 RepID=UPI001FFA7567|nr:alpha/beta hydrolase [Luteibacter aegosomatissinici]UPG94670.1 alpha/beta hydrolase [Luteibacter aegosomatissinici]